MSGNKLVVLGGSSPKTAALFGALAHARELNFDEVCLVGRSGEALESVGKFCRLAAERFRIETVVSWDTDASRAVRSARYALNIIRVGGQQGTFDDRRNLAVSGIVGHASSYGEAVRNVPATLELAHCVEQVAPDCVFINFTNPVSVVCEALASKSRLTCIGICHHAFSLRNDFARILEAHPEDVRVEYLGLNHLGWVTDVQLNGRSQMRRLVEAIVQRKLKKYNYQLIMPFGVIPIQHAFSLYRKGEVLYVRQAGVRASLQDFLWKCLSTIPLKRPPAERNRVPQPIIEGRLEFLQVLEATAPWYANCIVPFLRNLESGAACEHIVNWRHGGRVLDLPAQTAESTAVVERHRVRCAPVSSHLPDFAVAWLRQARDSERLLLRAILNQSFDLALQAMMIHPNVASTWHADRFLRHYFPIGQTACLN